MEIDKPKRKCPRCRALKDLDATQFKQTREGFAVVCKACSALRAQKRTETLESHRTNQQNIPRGNFFTDRDDAEAENDEDARKELGEVKLRDFLQMIVHTEDVHSFTALVDLSDGHSEPVKEGGESDNNKERANGLADKIWKQLKYRFIYHSRYVRKRSPSTRYMYHCAQNKDRQHMPQKSSKEGVKHRDKEQMASFDCNGWMHITVWDDSNVVLVKFTHENDHVPYWQIDVPDDIKKFVHQNLELTPTQLWDEILKTYPAPKFTRKAIYHIWHENSSKKWKHDADEVKSARIIIDKASKQDDLYMVESIPLPDEPGFVGIAFSLPEVLRKWGGKIREISLDSTWNTNGSNFEVYALLGEISGSGCPLGYLLLQAKHGSEGGEKTRYIRKLLEYFRKEWKMHPIVTLTDKDMSEINAFLAEFPAAKHQLCFWHCLRAIRTRLSILRRRPKFYDVKEANMEFPWIDKDFIPCGQANQPQSSFYIAKNPIPRISVMLQGVPQNTAPEPVPSTTRPLAIRLNGRVRSVLPVPRTFNFDSVVGSDSDLDDEHLDNDLEEENLECHLIKQVDKLLNHNEQDSENGPDWMFEEGETTSADPNFTFCPASHRKQILHLFTKHFCQHPIFPERHHGTLTANQIRRNAVKDMYDFCYVRGLREVWGYMWACWYTPKMWRLWARSTSPRLPRLRTTMGVENFWRQLKHNYLHNYARPRLDQLVWVLIYNVTPSYIARMETLDDGYRLGRSKGLTTYQRRLKESWSKLEAKRVSETVYATNVSMWTCDCGSQKYHAHHLCKHLVHAVGHPDKELWRHITRRRVAPIYRHRLLIPKDANIRAGEELASVEPDDGPGSITDGDDYSWSGNPLQLHTRDGWMELTLAEELPVNTSEVQSTPANSASRKRTHPQSPTARDNDANPAESKRPRIEAADLTHSSPLQEIAPFSDASGFDYGTDDELELDELSEDIDKAIEGFQEIIETLKKQKTMRNRIWMKTARERIGNNISEFNKDIRTIEHTGRTRITTWGEGKSKEEKRLSKLAMGFTFGL